MPRLKPTSQELKRINLLHQRVQTYFEENWHDNWARHGENFTGFENIHVKNAFYEAVESAIEEKLIEKYGSQAGNELTISKHSVRRFFRNEVGKGYDTKVLNGFLLLIGETVDWEDFQDSVQVVSPVPQPTNGKRLRTRNYLYSGGVLAAVLMAVSFYYFYENQSPVTVEPILTAEILPSEGYPKSIRVHYDLSGCEFRNAALMFSNEKITLLKPKGDTIVTSLIPNYVPLKLFLDNESAKEERLLLTSNGWAGSINNVSTVPEVNFRHNDVFHFINSAEIEKIYGEYYCSFLNFRDFNVDGESVKLSADIKNPGQDGGIWAYDISVDIIGTEGRVVFNLLNPDAIVFAQLAVAQTNFRRGKRSAKLAKLGVDLTDWRHLNVETRDHRITIKLDDELLIDDTYEGDIGEVVGLQFYTKGSGWVKNVKLNGENL